MTKAILITGLIIVAVFNYGQTLQKDTLAKETGVTNKKIEITQRRVLLQHHSEELHFPYLLEAPDGTWYMTYREGGHGAAGGDRVHCIQSSDRGQTWQTWPGLTPDPLQRQFFRTRLSDGSLISYRFRLESSRPVADGSEATAMILRSFDEGATWTSFRVPIKLPFHPSESGYGGLWGPAVEIPDGRLLWGLWTKAPESESDRGPYISVVVESTDNGNSFSYLAPLCDNPMIGERGPYEPNLVRLHSGELLSVIRTGLTAESLMIQVRSRDGGHTWSTPEKLCCPGASPQLLLLGNGVLILTFGTRENVHLMASWDGTGDVWSEPMLIFDGFGSGYTNIQALDDDRFFMVYSESSFQGRQHREPSRIIRLDLTVRKGY